MALSFQDILHSMKQNYDSWREHCVQYGYHLCVCVHKQEYFNLMDIEIDLTGNAINYSNAHLGVPINEQAIDTLASILENLLYPLIGYPLDFPC